jgi:hypothetical protein
MLKGVGADELNAKGAGMCRGFNALANKFPFNPAAKTDATLDDVNRVFRPADGLLPAFYKENLQKYLKKEGDEYKPTGEPGPIHPADHAIGYELSGNQAVFKGDLKLVRNMAPVGDGQWHLYDLRKDPGETRDLRDSMPEVFAALKADYEAYARSHGVLPMPPGYSGQQMIAEASTQKIIEEYGLTFLLAAIAALVALLIVCVLIYRYLKIK